MRMIRCLNKIRMMKSKKNNRSFQAFVSALVSLENAIFTNPTRTNGA